MVVGIYPLTFYRWSGFILYKQHIESVEGIPSSAL